MATGSSGVVAASGLSGEISEVSRDVAAQAAATAQQKKAAKKRPWQVQNQVQPQEPMSGQGAQFVYVAATVANILCDNLSQTQINLLANFLSVVTTCAYAILTVENPTDVLQD